jgi:hypothetical protein
MDSFLWILEPNVRLASVKTEWIHEKDSWIPMGFQWSPRIYMDSYGFRIRAYGLNGIEQQAAFGKKHTKGFLRLWILMDLIHKKRIPYMYEFLCA